MQGLRRYRVGLALVVLAVVLGVLVFYRLKDQQARAVQRPRGDTLVGVVMPARRDLEVRFAATADIAPLARAVIGGLAVSTVFTLILIPTLYVMVETRFPRRVETRELSLTPQGESA